MLTTSSILPTVMTNICGKFHQNSLCNQRYHTHKIPINGVPSTLTFDMTLKTFHFFPFTRLIFVANFIKIMPLNKNKKILRHTNFVNRWTPQKISLPRVCGAIEISTTRIYIYQISKSHDSYTFTLTCKESIRHLHIV